MMPTMSHETTSTPMRVRAAPSVLVPPERVGLPILVVGHGGSLRLMTQPRDARSRTRLMRHQRLASDAGHHSCGSGCPRPKSAGSASAGQRMTR